MNAGKTSAAKQAAKKRHLEQLTIEERIMLPLYLHYRSLAMTKYLKASIESGTHHKNS